MPGSSWRWSCATEASTGSSVKVADFGLAKALERTVASNSGGGTIAYMAPECFKGALTHQSDQYSLAVTYYHLRTGRLLFSGDQAQVMYAHLEAEPELSALPKEERAVLARALAKEPAKRWPTCGNFAKELVEALRAWAGSELANAFAYYKRGVAWFHEGDWDNAIRDFSEAIRLDSRLALTHGALVAIIHRNRGLNWCGEKNYREAARDFEEALRLNPKDSLNYLFLAKLLATCPEGKLLDANRAVELARFLEVEFKRKRGSK